VTGRIDLPAHQGILVRHHRFVSRHSLFIQDDRVKDIARSCAVQQTEVGRYLVCCETVVMLVGRELTPGFGTFCLYLLSFDGHGLHTFR